VSFPIKNAGSFHSYVNVYQRVSPRKLIYHPTNITYIWHHHLVRTSLAEMDPELHRHKARFDDGSRGGWHVALAGCLM
jgi:hypothetical protein